MSRFVRVLGEHDSQKQSQRKLTEKQDRYSSDFMTRHGPPHTDTEHTYSDLRRHGPPHTDTEHASSDMKRNRPPSMQKRQLMLNRISIEDIKRNLRRKQTKS